MLKVLWSVNFPPPDIAKKVGMKRGHAISWVDAMRTAISNDRQDIKLVIVCNGGNKLKQVKILSDKNVLYYILPQDIHVSNNWKMIIEQVKPDIIHAYGTEQRHNDSLINQYVRNIPIIISLQGLITEYAKHYYASIPIIEIIKNYTFRDILRGGIFAGKRKFLRQSKWEKEMLRTVSFVEGRSDWDKAISLDINPDLKYYYCPRMIRTPFFKYEWNEQEFEPHSIFVHQGGYPIKGFHFMIDALSIICKKYTDAKLYISGDSFLKKSKIKESGYMHYLRKKIQSLNLQDSIVFTGYLEAEELAEKLSKVNVCVVPSAIENAPNALAEAMIVGTPCVASYVGGNAEMLDYGKYGMLYCYYEPQLLAERIDRLFNYGSELSELSKKTRAFARQKHDPKKLEQTLVDIYFDAIKNFEDIKENIKE